MKTILLATDGSPSARKATAAAVELAHALGAHLRVVTVWCTPVYSFGYTPVSWTPELIAAERGHAEEVLESAVEEAAAEGVGATPVLREGDAATEIVEAAHEIGADLIVVGAHGWGPFRRFVFGSVSTRVLHEADAAVLVVRGDPVAETESLEAAAAAPEGR